MRLFYRLLLSQSASAGSRPWDEIMAQCPECRWITLKPHGDADPSYVHVLIRPSGSGFRVVWAGSKDLLHLRVENPRRADAKPTPKVDPAKRAAVRQKLEQDYEKHLADMVSVLAQRLNIDPQHLKGVGIDAIVRAVKRHGGEIVKASQQSGAQSGAQAGQQSGAQSGAQAGQQSGAQSGAQAGQQSGAQSGAQAGQGQQKDWEKIADRDKPQGVNRLSAAARRAFASELSVIAGTPIESEQLPQPLKDALSQMDESTARDLLAVMRHHEQQKRRYNKAVRETVEEREGYLARAESVRADDVLNRIWSDFAKQESNRILARRNIGLWQAFDQYGAGVARHYLAGAHESALAVLGDALGVTAVPSELVGLLGVEGAAQFVVKQIRSELGDTDADAYFQKLRALYEQKVDEAAQQAERLLEAERDARQRIQALAQGQDPLYDERLERRELAREMALRRRQIGQITGSLSFYAAVLDAWRRKQDRKPLTVSASGQPTEIREHARRHGLEDGTHYLLVEDKHGRVRMELTQAGEQRLLSRLKRASAPGGSNTALPDDWRPNGLPANVKLQREQLDAIQFALDRKRVVWNLAAGIGKSLASLALGKELLDRGEVQKVIYIVPSGLRENMLAESHKFFGNGLRVAVAGKVSQTGQQAYSPYKVAESGKQRASVIADTNAQVVIVGMDTLADGDAQAIRQEIQRLGGKALVVVDEAHQAFSPGAGQSQRMQAMETIAQAFNDQTYAVAMTGTPVRQSVSDIATIARWATGNPDFDRDRFLHHYQGVETASNILQEVVDESLQRALAPVVITRDYEVQSASGQKVQLERRDHAIALTPEQVKAIRDAEAQWQQAKQGGKPSENPWFDQYMALFAPKGRNPLAEHVKQVVDDEYQNGNRGLIFVNFLEEVDAVAKHFAPGEVIRYTGDMSPEARAQARLAINEGKLIVGGRAEITHNGKQVAGVVTAYDDRTQRGKLRLDNGQEVDFDSSHNPQSRVKAMVATAAGSTGLNLQKGASYVVHYTPAWTEAERKQRLARVYRTNQAKDTVREYNPSYDVPHALAVFVKQALQRNAQESLLRARGMQLVASERPVAALTLQEPLRTRLRRAVARSRVPLRVRLAALASQRREQPSVHLPQMEHGGAFQPERIHFRFFRHPYRQGSAKPVGQVGD